jgi:hypothetical protein
MLSIFFDFCAHRPVNAYFFCYTFGQEFLGNIVGENVATSEYCRDDQENHSQFRGKGHDHDS